MTRPAVPGRKHRICEPLASRRLATPMPLAVPALHPHDEVMTPRWTEVLGLLTAAVPHGRVAVVVDGTDEQAGAVADRLAEALRAAGRPCVRLRDGADGWPDGAVAVADGPDRRS